eukprot:TRINITY_DN71949_c0_g1_i1.p1 TRINITY_DN71949_c0_g1~~TRINITY_DN71949_c0_g1_i1.p1  ORF type:complete len:423 (-),score=65.32 TRINITY_DN71949_c0_g1_i1:31-1299(-)
MRLYYFDAPGRAEAIRLLLNHTGICFDDVRIKFQDWPQYKERFELKQLPVLEDNGKQFCQSYAILSYLGAKYGYLPKDYDKLYRVLFVMNTAEDIYTKAFLCMVPQMSPLDEKARAELKDNLLNTTGPLFMGALEKKLKENETQDYMVGNNYTIADFYLLGLYQTLVQNEEWNKTFMKRIEDKYPTLYKYAQKRIRDFNPYYKKCKTKLYYFDIPGRAEMIRVMLKKMGMPFEDVRIKFEEWPAQKASGKFELQQLPVLECEPCGVLVSQTDAIMQRVGNRFGYYPMDKPKKIYKILWWCGTWKDVMEGCNKFFLNLTEDKKKSLRQDFFEKSVPVLLQAMENKLKIGKSSCYAVGRQHTIADFYAVGVWRGYINNPMFPEFKGIIDKYPMLKSYCECHDKKIAQPYYGLFGFKAQLHKVII